MMEIAGDSKLVHREWEAGQTVAIFEEKPVMICDGLGLSATVLQAQNRRKMAHFIAACG